MPVGRQRGQDQRRARAQVADLHLRAVQRRATGDDRVMGVHDVDLGAHPAKLGQPLEAVLEDRLVDVRGALRLRQQDRGRRLEVGRETRVGAGLDVDRPEAGAAQGRPVDLDGVGPAGDPDAGPRDGVDERAEVVARARPSA